MANPGEKNTNSFPDKIVFSYLKNQPRAAVSLKPAPQPAAAGPLAPVSYTHLDVYKRQPEAVHRQSPPHNPQIRQGYPADPESWPACPVPCLLYTSRCV